jgi:tRNA pseudouridine38-40 synthase
MGPDFVRAFSSMTTTFHVLKLTIEYDGTDFVGWQIQENGRSVQGEIEHALDRILRERHSVIGSGRTDAGVHARAQVAHCRVTTSVDIRDLHHSLNSVLPEDIAITGIEEVPEGFHARYSAVERRYKYFISEKRSPLHRRYDWWVKFTLDIEQMNRCAGSIIGEHDFASFCRTKAEVNHHRCIVSTAIWSNNDSRYIFEIAADRFLHGMVRTLVGTMVDVGRGFLSSDDFLKILNERDRRAARMAAPPHGLFLWEVKY